MAGTHRGRVVDAATAATKMMTIAASREETRSVTARGVLPAATMMMIGTIVRRAAIAADARRVLVVVTDATAKMDAVGMETRAGIQKRRVVDGRNATIVVAQARVHGMMMTATCGVRDFAVEVAAAAAGMEEMGMDDQP